MVDSTWIKALPQPLAVIGLGKSGLSAFKLLNALGITGSSLMTYDDRDLIADFQNPTELHAKNPKTLVVSPGVSLKTPWIQKLIADGAFLTSEISLAASLIDTEKIIGVTGSVGKSTVVSILGEGAKVQDSNAFIGGNLGIPFCDYALKIIQGGTRSEWIILELSSYQLENSQQLKLEYSAITYLSANHLERYADLNTYYNTKLKITEITKNFCVFNVASEDALKYSALAKGKIKKVSAALSLTQEQRLKIKLIGSHNHDNFAVAKSLAELAGWPDSAMLAMAAFIGLPHRLELVGTFNSISYINDSKATAIDSVLVAAHGCLENLTAQQKVFLLLGGKDKNLPWENLAELKKEPGLHFVFFGACGQVCREKSQLSGKMFQSLHAAITHCLTSALPGDTVLLSPGGTSLDEFKNFEERGDYFKKMVLNYYK